MVALSTPESENQASQTTADHKLPTQSGLLSNMQSMEEVGQLVMNMSQAGQHGDIFKIFAEHVNQLVPGLTHISVLLLPAAQHKLTSTTGTEPLGSLNKGKPSTKPSLTTRLDWQQYMGGTKSSKAEGGKKVEPDLLTWPYADLQTGNDLPVLDWRSCKEVLITLEKGVNVQHPAAAYPASCTAACYVARTHADSVTTPDYLQDGPHFADWGEMQEQGAVSMASAPIHMSNEVVAVLTLASSQQAAFEGSKAKLVWVLSFVLAPYTHMLSQATPQTEAHRFIEGVMPRLLEQSHAQQAAALQEALGTGRDMPLNADAHPGPLCSQCQSASKAHPGSPSKQGGDTAGAQPSTFSTHLEANSTAASVGLTHPHGQSAGRTFHAGPHLGPQDSALDWGDFFFNLVSMCIMYAHFSEAAAAGEVTTAVVFSMTVAAVDCLLLAVRWLWYDHFLTHGGRSCSMFNLYRLTVLPVANTWISWTLLHKLHWDPTPPLLAALGLLMTLFLLIGLKVRFFLHAPLQLATVLLAAATAQNICTAVQGSTSGAACLSLISAQQLVLGLLIPSFLTFMLDFRVGTSYMPHIQAKSWAVIPS